MEESKRKKRDFRTSNQGGSFAIAQQRKSVDDALTRRKRSSHKKKEAHSIKKEKNERRCGTKKERPETNKERENPL